ncbi:MAG: 4-(cytidine 5'-diphospho)-2-C-methyl-D-erythritol kinase, partial [Oscillospiraceae bacterium]|nr:4-(cytidine 5'-diphospho)-2-C-methyl-D-erythritol kinase [Oscillospiraceae bacterium]
MKKAYRAYAKINLLLDVTGKRPDGYHSVAMIMQSIDLHDTVTVEAASGPGIEIACNLPYIPTDRRNIAWKACEAFGITEGLKITLEKRIPGQAGLGGGSADAAAVLTALRDMFRPGMPDGALREIGARVGADVPFCLAGGCCLAEGIGELLTPLPCLPEEYEIEVLKPSAGVNTARAYAALDSIDFKRPQTALAVGYARRGDWERLFPLCENVFEQAARFPG